MDDDDLLANAELLANAHREMIARAVESGIPEGKAAVGLLCQAIFHCHLLMNDASDLSEVVPIVRSLLGS